MRRSLFAFVLFGALSCAQQAAAIKLTLAYPAVLRAGRRKLCGDHDAPAGTEVKILRDDPLDAHRHRQEAFSSRP
jgi:hypothetical protein